MKSSEEWYATKIGKTVKEFDAYDQFVAKIATEYALTCLQKASENASMLKKEGEMTEYHAVNKESIYTPDNLV